MTNKKKGTGKKLIDATKTHYVFYLIIFSLLLVCPLASLAQIDSGNLIMRKISFNEFVVWSSILSNIITIGGFVRDFTGWAWNNIFCNPFFRICVCSLIFTILLMFATLFKNKSMRIISYVFIAAIAIVVFILLPKGDCVAKPITKSDTVIKPIDSTVHKSPVLKKKETTHKEVKQTNTNGNNEANQNSGENNGNIGGHDNKVDNRKIDLRGNNNTYIDHFNVYINKELELTEEGEKFIIDSLARFMAKNKIKSKNILLSKTPNSEGRKIYLQIVKLLRSNGYYFGGGSPIPLDFQDDPTGTGEPTGIRFYAENGEVEIVVGILNP